MYDELNAEVGFGLSLIGPQRRAARGAAARAARVQRAPGAGPARCSRVLVRACSSPRASVGRFLRALRALVALSATAPESGGSTSLYPPMDRCPTRTDSRSGTPALAAEGVHKSFKIPEERSHTLKERALHPLRRSRHEELHALKDISFAVEPGEFFGIVGRNGSGKSTLLKCLAGIYRADAGRIWCNGRMSTFIELGRRLQPRPRGLRERRAERHHARASHRARRARASSA